MVDKVICVGSRLVIVKSPSFYLGKVTHLIDGRSLLGWPKPTHTISWRVTDAYILYLQLLRHDDTTDTNVSLWML